MLFRSEGEGAKPCFKGENGRSLKQHHIQYSNSFYDTHRSPPFADPPPPTTVRVENLKGGFDYIFHIYARNAKGCSEPVVSKQVSPSAVVVAKSKEDLPKIFNRFGIDLSKAENVKQALSILWNRYEKNEFYFEVNERKQVRQWGRQVTFSAPNKSNHYVPRSL